MLRSSDENSTRGGDSRLNSPEENQVQFASRVESVDGDELSRNIITEAERAQIWAALSKQSSKSSSLSHPHPDAPHSKGGLRLTKITTAGDDDNKSSTKRSSKVKKFGSALKRIFMNDQTVPQSRHRRRDSWDDIYRCKDVSKIRPVHEEYGAL